ncbi:MAG: hypothetical protein ABH842_03345 [Candidatus Micrarchaeota archaeon]
MNNILNTPAEVLALDVNDTLIRMESGKLVPMTSCLPDALAEASRTMDLFLASNHSHDDAAYHLDLAGVPSNVFTRANTGGLLPSKILSVVFQHHPSACDEIGKLTAMYGILATLGIPTEHVIEAISGKRKFDFIVGFGDSEADRMAASVFGFRYCDVTRLTNGHTLSSILGGIHRANLQYEGPRWKAVSRPVTSQCPGQRQPTPLKHPLTK